MISSSRVPIEATRLREKFEGFPDGGYEKVMQMIAAKCLFHLRPQQIQDDYDVWYREAEAEEQDRTIETITKPANREEQASHGTYHAQNNLSLPRPIALISTIRTRGLGTVQ